MLQREPQSSLVVNHAISVNRKIIDAIDKLAVHSGNVSFSLKMCTIFTYSCLGLNKAESNTNK